MLIRTIFSVLPTIRINCLWLIIFLTSTGYAQVLFPAYNPIYNDDVVARIDVNLHPDSLAFIVAEGNEESEYYFHATFTFDNGTIRDTFENVGFQLRGNTSRFARKKSFQISLNTYAPGRRWYGVDKINLNGEHNDPTVSRSKIAWNLLHDIGLPAPRSNHVELYINGEYFGLYVNVEHIDGEFMQSRFGNEDGNLYKCLWPADMAYLGDDPNLYKLKSGDRRVYELKTNEEQDDYSDLAFLINVLNTTPINNLPCELEKIFNVNSFLQNIAFDILSGNWDGALYNKNNFYLYHNQATGLFEYIPYDLDNTFGIDWFNVNWSERDIYAWGHPNQPRPLYWRILSVQKYKDRLSFYLNSLLLSIYQEEKLFPGIDSIKSLIAPSIFDDEYYTFDYGFDASDFQAGFEEALPYSHTPIGVKEFITNRRSATVQQLQLHPIDPIISQVHSSTDMPANEIIIKAFIEDDQSLLSAEISMQWDGTGPVYILTMHDDGILGDTEAGDGWYCIVVSFPDTTTILHYTIAAVDIDGHVSLSPVCDDYQIALGHSAVTLAINEFMASNTTIVADESAEFEDWVEIYNYGNESIHLSEYYLSDKSDNPVKWSFPDVWIEAKQFLLIWADEDQDQGPLHANFKLGAGGEFIGIFDRDANNNVLIDGLDFGAQTEDISFGRFPNATGPFMTLHPTPGAANVQLTSTHEETALNSIKLYPNPVGDELHIEIPGNTKKIKFEIVNSIGQSVSTGELYDRMDIQMRGMNEGLYFIRFHSVTLNKTIRFVKG